MNMTVSERLLITSERCDTTLCCGLDPDPCAIKERGLAPEDFEAVRSFLLTVIDLTSDIVCAYKVQKAFFDLLPDGHQLLRSLTRHVRSHCPDTVIILDCKAGDVGNTMRAYYSYAFDLIGVDSLMLNPLLGACVWQELTDRPESAGCIMVRTSNPEAQEFQDLVLSDGEPFWYRIATRLVEQRVGCDLLPVFSHTRESDLRKLRALIPDDVPILFAGYGVQGVSSSGVRLLANSTGRGVIVNSSRGILFAVREGEVWPQESIRRRATEARDSLEYSRHGQVPKPVVLTTLGDSTGRPRHGDPAGGLPEHPR